MGEAPLRNGSGLGRSAMIILRRLGVTRSLVLASSAVLLLVTGPATAAVTTFTDRTTFETAVSGFLVSEGFEGLAPGPVVPPESFASGLEVDVSGGTVAPLIVDADPPPVFGYTNTTPGGANALAFEGTGNYVVSFRVPLGNAFGFDLSGFQPVTFASGGFTIEFLEDGILVESTFVADVSDFTVEFHGFTTDASFDEVLIEITTDAGTADFAAFDEVTFVSSQATAVPTLGTLALGLLAATLGLTALRLLRG